MFMLLSIALYPVTPQLFPPEDNPRWKLLSRTNGSPRKWRKYGFCLDLLLYTWTVSISNLNNAAHRPLLCLPPPHQHPTSSLLFVYTPSCIKMQNFSSDNSSREIEYFIIEAISKRTLDFCGVHGRVQPDVLPAARLPMRNLSRNASPRKPKNFWESEIADIVVGVEDSIVIVGI
ncbi:hypothetical protein BDQ12DRAFT_674034 [Crucibulum laeve]|uniref:Uncharacterized protein n=1 Tax=Crucibulum laeve TaxID=68775 RepID=A0A5C3MI76_9AGAR|nr:hypothetical protein BDQ12DRAFT_674034 [Crucibulum laeve]